MIPSPKRARRIGAASIAAGIGLATIGVLVSPASAHPTFVVADHDAHLKIEHHGATNPGHDPGTCPTAPEGKPYGWHFVFQGSDTEFVALSVHFQNAGILEDVEFVSHPDDKHAYVYTAGADTLLDAVADTNGGSDTDFNLSHVCTPAGSTDDGTTDDGTTDDGTTDDGTTDDGTTDDGTTDDGTTDDGTTDDGTTDDGTTDDGTTD
ncbi:MAG: hypothetical protein ACSLFP_19060, partial [Acidimicrobiales bacterium]